MKKHNSFDDIIPPKKPVQKRSIRDIPLPPKKQNKIEELLKETEDFRAEHHHDSVPVRKSYNPYTPKVVTRSYGLFWTGIAGLIVILVAGYIFLFNGATVTISVKTETIPVEIAVTSAPETSNATGTLPYKVLPLQKTATREVSATGAPVKVEKKASGTIIIYNNYSATPQQLIATTRFETPEGLVYRLDKAVTVPGISIKNGQSMPGSVEAKIVADQIGTKYNIEKSDFTVPGFKGTPKYEGFYARSKTAIAGGYSGNMPQISDADLKAANDDLKQALTLEVFKEIEGQKTNTQVFFKEGARISYSSEVAPGETGKGVVTGKLTVEALLFERSTVEENIALNQNGKKYRYDNLESLTLEILNIDRVTSFISEPVLLLKLSGTLTTGQSFDEEALRQALADRSKMQLQEILNMYPEITKANAVIIPFFSRSFPKNEEKIDIVVTKE